MLVAFSSARRVVQSPLPAEVSIHSWTVQAGRSHLFLSVYFFVAGRGKRYVVVDVGSPAGNDGCSSVSVGSDGADEWPELVLLVHQDRTRVVTNNVLDTVVEPCLDSITVVHTSDRRRDDTVGTELVTGCDADLREPCLVP